MLGAALTRLENFYLYILAGGELRMLVAEIEVTLIIRHIGDVRVGRLRFEYAQSHYQVLCGGVAATLGPLAHR